VRVSAITLTENGAAATADINNIKIYNSDNTLLGTKASLDSNGQAVYSGLNWEIPAGGTDYLTVKADVGVYGQAVSGNDTQFQINTGDVTARGKVSGTAVSTAPSATTTVNTFELWKAIPTITTKGVSVDGTSLANGTSYLYKFQVTATGGTIDLYQFEFTYATSGAAAGVTVGSWVLKDLTDGTDVDASCSVSGTTVTCTDGTSEEIAAGSTHTYGLQGAVTGLKSAGDGVSVKMNTDVTTYGALTKASTAAAAPESIVWSDESNTSHSTSTADWTNGYWLEDDTEYNISQTRSK